MEKLRKRRNTGRVTLQDVANFAGVGSMTVSRALRTPDQVSDKLRQKIEEAVETLGYLPNRAAGALASANSNIIALLIPSLTDSTHSRFVQSLQGQLNRQQFQVLLGCHEYNQKQEGEILMSLLQSSPAALVVFGSQLSDQTWQTIERSGVPAINVSGFDNPAARVTINTPYFDAAHRLTEHLLVQGYRNIGYIAAQMDNRLQRQQLSGWNKAMISHYQNADLVLSTPDVPTLQLGRYSLSEMLLRRPELDAVICSHEEIAQGVYFECQRRMLKIPRDMAVVCLDGSANCDNLYPTLTAIRIDYQRMGKETCKQLLLMLAEDDMQESHYPFDFSLEKRASS